MHSIFFDLDHFDRWHRLEIEEMLSESERCATNAKIVTVRKAADFTVGFGGGSLKDPLWTIISPPKFTNDVVWDMNDSPTGLQPGLYCSLQAGLYNTRFHRSFCYWLRYNELIRPFPLDMARVTYSFVGAISSGLRARMIEHFRANPSPRREIREQGGPWKAMLDRSGLATKQDYSNSIQHSKFVLCPRGNGVGSIRMFEVMEAQRVPVIISDNYVLPEGPRWMECSLRVRERDLSKIDQIILAAEPQWERMAMSARKQWEEHFSRARILDEIGRLVSNLSPDPGAFQKIRAVAFRGEGRLRSTIPRKINQLKKIFSPLD